MDRDDLARLQLEYVLANMRAPWYLRARRRLAFVLGHDLGLVQLGYLVDYDRDRYADFDFEADVTSLGDLPDGRTSGQRPGDSRTPERGSVDA